MAAGLEGSTDDLRLTVAFRQLTDFPSRRYVGGLISADVAQLEEHRICNPEVVGSSPTVSSSDAFAGVAPGRPDRRHEVMSKRPLSRVAGEGRMIGVGYRSGQTEQTVNLPANAYGGSNPPPTIGGSGGTRSDEQRSYGSV